MFNNFKTIYNSRIYTYAGFLLYIYSDFKSLNNIEYIILIQFKKLFEYLGLLNRY